MALLLFHSSFHFWVGPNGSDTAAGAGVSAQLPFATLQRAQQAVRSRPADSAATVTVLPGVYYQDAPLRFGVLDGGSDASRVTWQAAGGGDSVLSFGHAIPAGAAWSQSSANIWTLQLPQVAQGAFYPRQLWRLNDAGRSERLTRARSPDMQIPLDGTLPGEVNRGFRYRDGDLNKYDWSALDELELVVYASWTSGRKYVASLNTSAPFEVRFTAPTGFAPAGMWPNSGNRYYAENAVELVDAPGEWHVSRAGVLTLCSDDAPSGHRFVLDRGDALKEGVLVHGTSDETATLLAGRTSTTKTLPAASTPLGLGSWNLSCVVQTHDAAAAVVRRGPPSGEHVPGDLHLSLVGGAPMVDVGWEGDLHSLTSSGGRQRAVWRESFGVRGGTNVADGQPHALEVRYDGAANTWVLLVDGRVDASATFPFVEKAADDWLLEIAPGAWAADACVANVTLAFCETQPVRNLHFDGLQVQHVGWGLDRALTTQDDFQACSYLDTAALHLVRAQNVSLTGMRVEHVGGIGVWVEGGSGDVQIVRTGVFDVGAGALRVGRGTPLSEEPAEHVTSHVLVNDSRFVNGSRVYSAGNGVLLQRSPFFTLANSEVAYFNHVGVSVGWEWDAKLPPSSQHNTIERNHVHHLGNYDLTDLAGIYTLGAQPGTVIRENVVHDAHPYFMYGHGIYLDEGSSDILIERNWVSRTCSALFMLHYGVNNTVRNNIFAWTQCGCLMYDTLRHVWTPALRNQSCDYAFERNIVAVAGDGVATVAQGPNGKCNASFANNTWFNFSGAMTSSWPGRYVKSYPGYPSDQGLQFEAVNASFAQWQAAGQDVHGTVADPAFVAPRAWESGDFRVAASSPAVARGFEPLDLRGVGPSW